MGTPNPARRALLVLLGLSAVAISLVLLPVAAAILTAIVLAVALWPLQARFARKLRGRRNVSAGILTTAVVVLCAVPVIGVSAFVVDEGSRGIAYVAETLRSEGVTGLIERFPEPLRELVDDVIDMLPRRQSLRLDETVKEEVASRTEDAAVAVGAVVAATGQLLFQLAMMTIALYFLLAQGDEAVAWIERVSPLGGGRTRELIVELKCVSYALVMSMLLTSASQAFAAFIGYIIARVPHPVFFAVLTFVIAFIPALGGSLVALFAALLMLATGHPYSALFLAVWGVLVVGLVDNLVKPYVITSEVHLPGAVVFFALIGGLAAFGAVGLLIGPLAAALFVIALRMYRRDFATGLP